MLIICGMKHCGKSAIGRALSEIMHKNFIDLDDVIEAKFHLKSGKNFSCREIYNKFGEDFFREIEAESLMEMLSEEQGFAGVLALGGGTVSNQYLPPKWYGHNLVIYLECSPETLFKRISERGLPPYLKNETAPFQRFIEILAARKIAYQEAAGIVFKCSEKLTAAENAALLFETVREVE